jgi:uncharacterized protein YndB with AHSA1/START domain
MKRDINKEWIYEQSPAVVWEYLTQAELIALWLMPNDFQLTHGHEFTLHTKPMPELEMDGIFYCKILTIDPVKKLTYSWKAGPGNGIYTLDTVCEWTLEPHGKGTRLLLKHSGFGENNIDVFNGMNNGWMKKIENMMNAMRTKDQPVN